MADEPESGHKPAGEARWAEHTVVANLPRRFPGTAAADFAPLSEVEDTQFLLAICYETLRQIQIDCVSCGQTDDVDINEMLLSIGSLVVGAGLGEVAKILCEMQRHVLHAVADRQPRNFSMIEFVVVELPPLQL